MVPESVNVRCAVADTQQLSHKRMCKNSLISISLFRYAIGLLTRKDTIGTYKEILLPKG